MLRVICLKNCPSPFCVEACPSAALTVKENQVVVESDRCHGCGLCRYMCMTWSRDHSMRAKSNFWLAGRL
jgi:Fe-S-cluster-containing hydrogenase component 2